MSYGKLHCTVCKEHVDRVWAHGGQYYCTSCLDKHEAIERDQQSLRANEEYEIPVRKQCPDCKGETVYCCPEYLEWHNKVAAYRSRYYISQADAVRELASEEPTCGSEEHPCRTCNATGYVEEWMPISHLRHFLELVKANA